MTLQILFKICLQKKDLYTVSFFKTGHRVLHANFSTPVNFCPHENIQPSFVVKLWDTIMS
jgi:hypothetical protein